MNIARQEIGTTRNVVVKSPNSSLCLWGVLLAFVCELFFWLSSGTLVSHFLVRCFLEVFDAALAAF
jgi:hypothetical protein